MDEVGASPYSGSASTGPTQVSLASHRLAELARTLTFVREHSEYYGSLIPDGPIKHSEAPEILRSLPILDPPSWEEARLRLRTGLAENATIGFTNGTTGDPKTYYVTAREIRAYLDRADNATSVRHLNLVNSIHGPAASLMQTPYITCIALQSQHDFDRAARIISGDNNLLPGSRIEVLSGTVGQIKDLSVYMLHRYGSISGFGIRIIEASRHMLSPRWEQRLRAWWNADVIGYYGCSELSMCGARSCSYCGYYHLVPSCIGEVVDLSHSERYVAPGGRGALLVTAFHPYVEYEPRIRYRPGDAVELAGQPCPGWGEFGFRPLGRERYCFPVDDGAGLITPADCFQALADLPQVAVRHRNHYISGITEFNLESGSPRFSLRRGNGATELHVELRFDPIVWKDEAAEVERRIRSELDTRIPVVMHKPGDLADFYLV